MNYIMKNERIGFIFDYTLDNSGFNYNNCKIAENDVIQWW